VEVERAAIDVDVRDPHLDTVAQAVPPAGAAADQGVGLRLQVVVIVGQGGDVDQALDRQLDQAARTGRSPRRR